MLELSVDTKIQTADGEKLGEVDRFVVNPSRKEVTHVIVRRGALFTEERVVPISALHEENGVMKLRAGLDPAELPAFERGHYAEMGPSRLTPGSPNALVWAYPIPSMVGFPAYPSVPMGSEATVEENIPDGEVVMNEGEPVRSADGTEIGSVAEVSVNADGSLSHIDVDPGFFRSKRTIPSHWIDSVDAESVELAVGDDTLKELADL